MLSNWDLVSVFAHQANGGAEVIRRKFKKQLRKTTDEINANWVELLPLVRNQMHDVPRANRMITI